MSDRDRYPDELTVDVVDGEVRVRGRSSDMRMHPDVAARLASVLLDAVGAAREGRGVESLS